MMSTLVTVSANQVIDAKSRIAGAIIAHESAALGLTEAGVLMHVLTDLGIVLDVSVPNAGE